MYCEISNSSAGYSGATYYKGAQEGATSESCFVSLDADSTKTYGYWEFTGGSSPRATYSDTGSAFDGTVETFAASDCSTH